jgi:hypothetical protein
MLAMSHIEDEDLMEEFCAMAGTLYAPGMEAYAAFDRGHTVGCCLFSREEEELAFLACIWEEELGLGLCDGLLRAAMDYSQRRGAKRACFAAGFPEALLPRLAGLGYPTGGPFEIEEFFTGCKHCGQGL